MQTVCESFCSVMHTNKLSVIVFICTNRSANNDFHKMCFCCWIFAYHIGSVLSRINKYLFLPFLVELLLVCLSPRTIFTLVQSFSWFPLRLEVLLPSRFFTSENFQVDFLSSPLRVSRHFSWVIYSWLDFWFSELSWMQFLYQRRALNQTWNICLHLRLKGWNQSTAWFRLPWISHFPPISVVSWRLLSELCKQ